MQRHVFHSLGQRGARAALFGFVASSALATGASPMEGTWGGADAQGRTAQITILDNQVIGVFWGQDYHDAENVRSSKNGAQLDFTIERPWAHIGGVRWGVLALLLLLAADAALVSSASAARYPTSWRPSGRRRE